MSLRRLPAVSLLAVLPLLACGDSGSRETAADASVGATPASAGSISVTNDIVTSSPWHAKGVHTNFNRPRYQR